jgi:3-deoxy-D-manno-octulosonic-acid transferase
MIDQLSLSLYRCLTFLFFPFSKLVIKWRIKTGKEHAIRWREKLGEPSVKKPSGKLVWLHAVGLGEVLALRGLILELHKKEGNLNFLVTSSTVLSAEVFEKNIPPKTIHQFLPYDVKIYGKRFLRHWKPDLVIWSEQDVWPGLSCQASNFGIKQVLVNGKIRQESFSRRMKIKPLHRVVYKNFEFISTQDFSSKRFYQKLGASCVIRTDGSLKPHCPPLLFDKKNLKIIKRAISNKSVWVVGSSFLEDEKIAIYTQKLLIERNVRKLLVLVPRFPERAHEILNLLKDFEVKVYSKGETPDVKTDIFIVDSVGELGLWYKASEVALIGGTFSNVEGKNPWEALHLDCVITFGPRHLKFKDDFKLLKKRKLAHQINSSQELFKILSRKDQIPVSNGVKELKTKLKKDINSLTEELLYLIN